MDKRLEKVLPYVEGRKVLDIGFAGGTIGFEIKGWRFGKISEVAESAVGIDVQKDVVEKARNEGYNVKYGNVEKFNLDETFEVATAIELFEHLENPGKALENISEHLEEGGLLVFTTPNPYYEQRIRGNLFDDPNHVIYYSPESFRVLAGRHDFSEVEIDFVDWANPETFLGKIGLRFLPKRYRSPTWFGVYRKRSS